MINDIFNSMNDQFKSGTLDSQQVFYFSVDDTKKTVTISADSCTVEDGKTVENADCVCKTSADFLEKVWNDGYKPGLGDFLSGKIKSNQPEKLKTFLAAFGK